MEFGYVLGYCRCRCTSRIKKAFLQIALRERDQDFTRFLWVKTSLPLDDMVVYRFCKVAFGITWSPFLLASTIYSYFENDSSSFLSEVLSNLYVDNLLLILLDIESTFLKESNFKSEFSRIGINLKEFVSNKPETLKSFSDDDKLKNTVYKTLGLTWYNAENKRLRKFVYW